MKTLLALLLPWLGGLTLHPATGPTVHLPLPPEHAVTAKLLGPAADGGWVLTDERGDRKVVLVLHGRHLRTIRSVEDPQDATSFLLSSDGRHVVEVDAPTTAHADVWSFDLAGDHLIHVRLPGWVELLGYEDRTVFFGRSGQTVAWRPGRPAAVVARSAGLAVDPAHDALFTFEPLEATNGPTSLSAPGAQTWSLPSTDFFPRSFSPDGQYVAGLAGDANHVQVRRMSDGSLVSDWKRHLDFARPLVWTDTAHLVSVLRSRAGWALLRCTVGGDCVRASDPSGAPLSLPFQEVSFR